MSRREIHSIGVFVFSGCALALLSPDIMRAIAALSVQGSAVSPIQTAVAFGLSILGVRSLLLSFVEEKGTA